MKFSLGRNEGIRMLKEFTCKAITDPKRIKAMLEANGNGKPSAFHQKKKPPRRKKK